MNPQGQRLLPVNDLDDSGIDDPPAKRILVIEDDYPILEALAEILGDEGYLVSTANNGREALDHLKRDVAPNLILLDLRMPVMDGWTFRNVQKRTSHLASIPVIAISADGSSPAQAISADAFLRKPIDMRELLLTIRRVLDEDERKREISYRGNIERLASLGRVAAGVGHEINNPLAFVSMNVELASARLREISQNATPSLDIAENEAADLASLLADSLIGLERIRTTVMHLQILSSRRNEKREPVNIETVMDGSIAIAQHQIQHRARLTKQYGNVPLVSGITEELGQVFLNLLINSAHAIPEGNAQGNRVEVATSHDGTNVFVEITDTGRGVAADILPKIFDPFVSTKSTEEGTGLGLAICQRIVTDHGGRLTFESEVGRGSTCRLRLPALEAEHDRGRGERREGPAEQLSDISSLPSATNAPLSVVSDVRGRVLVIDDEVMIGRVITRTLSKRHDVVVFQDAKDAFARLAKDSEFDVVLCDLLMPNIGGARVYEVLASRWPHLASRLVFMTGGVFDGELSDVLKRAQRPVLAKPFSPSDLEALVNAHLQCARPSFPR